MNENRVLFVAVPSTREDMCDKCVFRDKDRARCIMPYQLEEVLPCFNDNREDGKNVYWTIPNEKRTKIIENRFKFAGKTYCAVPDRGFSCDGCAFFSFDFDCHEFMNKHNIPHCAGHERKDGRDVIFVEENEQ